jgi:ABC-2 type transport system permease protein
MPNPFGEAFRGLGAVLYKEALHIRRDQMALFFALVIPLLQMILLGFGIDTNVRQVKTVVLDENNREESRELIDRLRNSDTFRVIARVRTDRELNDAIVGGRAKVAVKIPWDYSDQLIKHGTAQVEVLIDGSDSSVAGQAINVSTAIGLDESLQRVLGDRQALPVEMRPQLLFNPDSRSPNFFLPGLMSVLLLNVTTFLTAFAIVREKEKGTLEQLFVTPVKPLGLMFGKILPYLAIGFGELCLILLMMVAVFRVPVHGNTVLLLLFSLPYLFVSLALGLLISSKANSQSEAMQLAFLTILPSIFFSGYIFPRDTMPLIFYLISYLVPAAYYINITRGIILRGAGIAHLWLDALVLLAMGIGLLVLAAKRFQKKIIAG